MGKYRLQERLGAGGMGEVWRVTHEVLGRTVAVKVMKLELLEEPTSQRRFRVEARAMAMIDHPGVVAVYDFDDTANAVLVMEYVNGESLSAILRREQQLSPTRTMELVGQAAEALHAAHGRGMVHRDVKPSNLLVRPNGTVVLTDFGIARLLEGTPLTTDGKVWGTPSYLAPEQVGGQQAGPQSDVYALGVVMYECLSGRRPFDRDSPWATAMARLNDPPPPLPAEIPPAVVEALDKALAREPGQRWRSAADLAAACRRTLPKPTGRSAAVTVQAPPRPVTVPPVPDPGQQPPTPRPRPRARLLASIVLIALVATLASWHPTRDLFGYVDDAGDADLVVAAATLSETAAELVHHLQDERVAAIRLLGTAADEDLSTQHEAVYEGVQASVDTARTALQQRAGAITGRPGRLQEIWDDIDVLLDWLPQFRARLTSGEVVITSASEYYGELIVALINLRDLAVRVPDDPAIGDQVRAAVAVSWMKEFLSQRRLTGHIVLIRGAYNPHLYDAFVAAGAGLDQAHLSFHLVATAPELAILAQVNGAEARQSQTMQRSLASREAGSPSPSRQWNAETWDDAMTAHAELLRTAERQLDALVVGQIADLRSAGRQRTLVSAGTLVALLLAAILLAWLVSGSARHRHHRPGHRAVRWPVPRSRPTTPPAPDPGG